MPKIPKVLLKLLFRKDCLWVDANKRKRAIKFRVLIITMNMKSIILEMLKVGCPVMFPLCSIFRKNVITILNYCRTRIILLLTENTVEREQLYWNLSMIAQDLAYCIKNRQNDQKTFQTDRLQRHLPCICIMCFLLMDGTPFSLYMWF